MKKYKFLKIMTSSLGIASVIGIGTTSIIGCAKKSNSAQIALAAFIASAKAESANNIVANAQPAAQNWENLSAKSGDLKIVNTTVKNKVVRVIIKSTSKSELATFSATYNNTKYLASIWICSQPPANSDGKTHSWTDFKVAAAKDSVAQMFSQASTQKTNWKISDQIIKLTSPVNNDATKTVTITLADRQASQQVNFVATYTTNRSFQSSDWATPNPAVSSKDNLTFKKINLPNEDQAVPGSNVQVKIGDVTYLGGMGGLWTSTNDQTWTKNSGVNISDYVRVSAIIEVNKNIFIATELCPTAQHKINPNNDKSGLFMTTSLAPFSFERLPNNIISDQSNITTLSNINGVLFIGTTAGLLTLSNPKEAPLLHKEIVNANSGSGTTTQATITSCKFIDNKIFVGTKTNGIWSAFNADPTFKKIPLNREKVTFPEIDFITKINNNIYVYVGNKFSQQPTIGLWVSNDQGVTFINKFSDIKLNPNMKSLGNSLSLINNDLYLSTNSGLYISDANFNRDTTIKFVISDTLGKGINVSNVIEQQSSINTLYAGTSIGLQTSSADPNLIFFSPNISVESDAISSISLVDHHIFVDMINVGDYTS